MKSILISCIFLFTLNCSINKVSNTHGTRFIENKYDKIAINKTNKNDVRKLIGPPSSISEFNNSWFYIERRKTNQSIFKLGKKKILENNIIILEFNTQGLVIRKDFFDLNNMNDIKMAETITNKNFGQDAKLYNILSSIRDKLNAPSRRDK